MMWLSLLLDLRHLNIQKLPEGVSAKHFNMAFHWRSFQWLLCFESIGSGTEAWWLSTIGANGRCGRHSCYASNASSISASNCSIACSWTNAWNQSASTASHGSGGGVWGSHYNLWPFIDTCHYWVGHSEVGGAGVYTSSSVTDSSESHATTHCSHLPTSHTNVHFQIKIILYIDGPDINFVLHRWKLLLTVWQTDNELTFYEPGQSQCSH